MIIFWFDNFLSPWQLSNPKNEREEWIYIFNFNQSEYPCQFFIFPCLVAGRDTLSQDCTKRKCMAKVVTTGTLIVHGTLITTRTTTVNGTPDTIMFVQIVFVFRLFFLCHLSYVIVIPLFPGFLYDTTRTGIESGLRDRCRPPVYVLLSFASIVVLLFTCCHCVWKQTVPHAVQEERWATMPFIVIACCSTVFMLWAMHWYYKVKNTTNGSTKHGHINFPRRSIAGQGECRIEGTSHKGRVSLRIRDIVRVVFVM